MLYFDDYDGSQLAAGSNAGTDCPHNDMAAFLSKPNVVVCLSFFPSSSLLALTLLHAGLGFGSLSLFVLSVSCSRDSSELLYCRCSGMTQISYWRLSPLLDFPWIR